MMILNTLEYDGQIEKIDSPDGEDRFRQALLAIPETSAFTSIPCGVCPVSFYAKPSTLGILFSCKSAVTEFVAVAELQLMHQTSTLLVSRLCLTTPSCLAKGRFVAGLKRCQAHLQFSGLNLFCVPVPGVQ